MLVYTEDFIISCTVFRLLPEEVLGNFIRLLMIDSYTLGTVDDTTRVANRCILAYLEAHKGCLKIDKKHKYAHTKCSKILDDMIDDETLEVKAKFRQLKSMALWCVRYLSNKFNLLSKVQLPDKRYLKLTGNFVLLCFLRGMDPVKLLQYFIDQVSWAKDYALNGPGESRIDPWMGFMAEMQVDYFQDQDELYESDFFDQHDKMNALRETMKAEPDYEKRLAAFTNCLKEMYASFHEVPINPCFLSEFIDLNP